MNAERVFGALDRVLGPLRQRVQLMIGLGLVKLIDDARGLQQLQASLLVGEVRPEVNRYQNYGLSSVPLPGAQGVFVAVGGNRNHLVAVAVDDARHRPRDLEAGEVCLYTDEGDRITLKRGRVIAVEAGAAIQVSAPQVTANASVKVLLATPLVETTDDLKVGGNIVAIGDITGATVSDATGSMAGMREVYNGHDHPGGNPTGVPNQAMS